MSEDTEINEEAPRVVASDDADHHPSGAIVIMVGPDGRSIPVFESSVPRWAAQGYTRKE